jgi:hypothetical protein
MRGQCVHRFAGLADLPARSPRDTSSITFAKRKSPRLKKLSHLNRQMISIELISAALIAANGLAAPAMAHTNSLPCGVPHMAPMRAFRPPAVMQEEPSLGGTGAELALPEVAMYHRHKAQVSPKRPISLNRHMNFLSW